MAARKRAGKETRSVKRKTRRKKPPSGTSRRKTTRSPSTATVGNPVKHTLSQAAIESAPYSLKDVAKRLSVSEKTVTRWIDDGKVDVERKYNHSGHLRFTEKDVEQYELHINTLSLGAIPR